MAASVEELEKTITALVGRSRRPRRGPARGRGRGPRCTRRSSCSTPGEARVAELVGDDVVVHQWLKYAVLLLFRLSQMETIELAPFEYADKIPLKQHFKRSGVRVVPGASARWGSYLAPGVGDDAELRQHRRPGRRRHDGRHLGHRRLVRADRRAGPPLGRGRHRWRARAAAGRAGDRRGRLHDRLALHRGRGRAGGRRRGARRRRASSPARSR